ADSLEARGMRTVTRDDRLDALDSLSLRHDAPVTLATALQVGTLTRATRLVTGTFRYTRPDGIEINGRLIDLKGPHSLTGIGGKGTLPDLFDLSRGMALQIAALDDARVPAAPPASGTAQADGKARSAGDPSLTLYEIVVRAVLEKDPDRRIRDLQHGEEINPRSPLLLRELANACFAAGRNAEALHWIQELDASQLPDAWRIHLLAARIHMAMKMPDAAIADLSRSVASGENAEAHLLLATIYADRHDMDRARAEVDLAAGLDPDDPDLPAVRSLLSRPGGAATPQQNPGPAG
ncbi:MAG TPA: tetratricopeptide repeat protein, partial [Candidatus Saccharimonadales bacterium]|nr:tetratricopeptide repeat protein [Candidatus Saccharimonadales bacterium]